MRLATVLHEGGEEPPFRHGAPAKAGSEIS